MDPFPVEPVLSLCTFLKDGDDPEDAVPLGVDDCWIETRVERGRNIYVVHAQFISRNGSPFYIESDTRDAAEKYIKDLKTAIGLTQLVAGSGPQGSIVYCPTQGAIVGTLANPYTDFSEAGCYCTSITPQDSGNRWYGIDITFEQPLFEGGAAIGTADFTFNGTDIGNQPGTLDCRLDYNFAYYTAKTRYVGTDAESYLASLADALNLSEITLHPLPRGSVGNRGFIKSYTASSADLVWVSESLTLSECWLQNLSGELSEGGILNITAEFVKVR